MMKHIISKKLEERMYDEEKSVREVKSLQSKLKEKLNKKK